MAELSLKEISSLRLVTKFSAQNYLILSNQFIIATKTKERNNNDQFSFAIKKKKENEPFLSNFIDRLNKNLI